MNRERFDHAVMMASESGVPQSLINTTVKIAELELNENSECPVPDCLAQLLIEASQGENRYLALRTLVEILDTRDQYFSHPDRDFIYCKY